MKNTHPFSQSQEDFLEALLMLEEKGETLSTTNVANILRVSKPAVHQMGHELIDRGLITRIDYGAMSLTKKGREVAERTWKRHRVLKEFLMELGVSEETAEKDCCEIEHALSEETASCIERYLEQKH